MNVAEFIKTLEKFPRNAHIVQSSDWNAPLLDLKTYDDALDPTLVLDTVRHSHLEATPR